MPSVTLEQADSDPTTEQVMARWEYVLTCLEKDPMQLEREVDWVIKWKWLQTYAAKRSLEMAFARDSASRSEVSQRSSGI